MSWILRLYAWIWVVGNIHRPTYLGWYFHVNRLSLWYWFYDSGISPFTFTVSVWGVLCRCFCFVSFVHTTESSDRPAPVTTSGLCGVLPLYPSPKEFERGDRYPVCGFCKHTVVSLSLKLVTRCRNWAHDLLVWRQTGLSLSQIGWLKFGFHFLISKH